MERSLIFFVFFWVFSHIIDYYSCRNECISIKLSQNVCLINIHILIYQHARCDCKLWSAQWFYCVFWVFSHITDKMSVSSPNFHRMCVLSIHTFWYINMSGVTASYGALCDFIVFFFWVFSHIIDYYSCRNGFIFTKLLQNVC